MCGGLLGYDLDFVWSLCGRPPQQPDGEEAAARARLLHALARLVPPVAAAAPAGGPGVAAAGAAALPEDWGLRAYGPLARAHVALEFAQPVSRAVRAARCCRLWCSRCQGCVHGTRAGAALAGPGQARTRPAEASCERGEAQVNCTG